jgi:hypothetical protein
MWDVHLDHIMAPPPGVPEGWQFVDRGFLWR